MSEGEKKIYVYDDFSSDSPISLGVFRVNSVRGTETYSFEYDQDWIKLAGVSISLDPELELFAGRQYPSGRHIFRMFSDSAPDRWGRMLMNKRERIRADRLGEKPRKLLDSDYLLGVYDETRMGGLRFKTDPDGPFLSNDSEESVPPWARLRSLEEASRNVEEDEHILNDKWIEQLLRPGSSLGGARPKATVIDPEGSLWIAKFPSRNDENNIGAWEKTAHDLAEKCGLNVPEAQLDSFSPLGSTYLVKRFDRDGKKRIHYASAMTLLGKDDGNSAADGTSYLDIVSFIKSSGSDPKNDLKELWKRIVFSMLITNSDDHLKNHAFIFSSKGWKLSPLFDVNPVPYGNELSLNVNEYDNTMDIGLAIETAYHYGLSEAEAKKISSEMSDIVKGMWEQIARENGLTRSQIEQMRPAFTK